MEWMLVLPIIVSFLAVLFFMPLWINKCRKIGLVWEDMNKYKHPKKVASSGGIVVVLGFVLGVLSYIAFRTFFRIGNDVRLQIFSLLGVILLMAMIGLTDDLLGWKNGGLSRKFRLFLALIASIPLIVINAGNSVISIPFLGVINVGLIYPLVLIPLAVVGASTTFNFLAGFNGLEAGQGILILSFLSLIAYINDVAWLGFVGLIMVVCLIGFLIFNFNPAKIFPGDILTYSIGALIAGMAILGNFEKIALFVFIPYILEVGLKSRGKLKIHSFGIPDKNNGLKMPEKKIYGLTHFSMFVLGKFKKRVTESDVVYFIWLIQILFILGAIFIWVV